MLQRELQSKCLMRRSHDPPSFSLHRLIKRHLLHRLGSDSGKYVNVFVQALHLIRAMVPHTPASSPLTSFTYDRTNFARYLPHVLSLDEAHVHCDQTRMEVKDDLEFIELLSVMGIYVLATVPFEGIGLARKLLEKVLEARKSVLGREHPDTLTSVNNLASVLSRERRYDEARHMHLQVKLLRETVLGKEHLDTLTSMNNLASVLSYQGELVEAENLYRQTLGLGKTILGEQGEQHPFTLINMNNLASVLDSQGRYQEAERICQQTCDLTTMVLGNQHPLTLTSLYNLASILDSQGRIEEAKDMHRRISVLAEGVLGKEHPDTLVSMNNVVLILNHQGKYKEAKEMY